MRSRISGARRYSSSPTPPGEAAAATCPGGRPYTKSLKDEGFVVITVAIERDAEDVREWIEKANPTHPSLIDTEHLLAELYNITNVPTVLWIDEDGRVVRPNDVAFTTEAGGNYANVSTDDQMANLRAWVRGRGQSTEAIRHPRAAEASQ